MYDILEYLTGEWELCSLLLTYDNDRGVIVDASGDILLTISKEGM